MPIEDTGLRSSISNGVTTVTISNNNGGPVIVFAHRILSLYVAGARVRLEGDCNSACALVTALPKDRICVGRTARLRIHQASYPNGAKDGRLTGKMLEIMPDWVQQRVGGPDRLGREFVEIGAAELLEYYDLCIE